MTMEHSSSKLLKLSLLPLLLVVVAAAQEEGHNNCTKQTCGHVDIPFPFGTTKECSLEPKFLINCTNNNETYLQDNGLPLRSISVDQGVLRVSLSAAMDCYSGRWDKFKNTESTNPFYNFENYSMSSSQNEFITVGCETLGIVVANSYSDSNFSSKPYVKTCVSYCQNDGDAKDGTCDGTGCCHVDIPDSEFKQGLSLISYGFENSLLNNSDNKIEFSPCGYAFLVEKGGEYIFKAADLMNNKLKNMTFPVVLDWSVGNITCEEAKKNISTYACKGTNAECYAANSRPGYLCKCLPGFHGNPYLPQGCTECEHTKEQHAATNSCQVSQDP